MFQIFTRFPVKWHNNVTFFLIWESWLIATSAEFPTKSKYSFLNGTLQNKKKYACLETLLWNSFSYFSHILVSWFSEIFLLLNPEQLFLLKWALIALFFDKVDGLRLFLFHWFRVALNAKIIPEAYLMRWRPETIHLKTFSFTQSEQNRKIILIANFQK